MNKKVFYFFSPSRSLRRRAKKNNKTFVFKDHFLNFFLAQKKDRMFALNTQMTRISPYHLKPNANQKPFFSSLLLSLPCIPLTSNPCEKASFVVKKRNVCVCGVMNRKLSAPGGDHHFIMEQAGYPQSITNCQSNTGFY